MQGLAVEVGKQRNEKGESLIPVFDFTFPHWEVLHVSTCRILIRILSFYLQVRMKSMFAIGFCFTALMGMFNSM